MKKVRTTTLIIAVIAVMFGFAIGSQASTGNVQRTLSYNNIKITLNGTALSLKDGAGNSVEPFIIDGTTYLPVRAVSEALGLNVDWDAQTHTVKLSNANAASSAGSQRSSVSGIRPEFKEAMDKYESYMNEYVNFMKQDHTYSAAWLDQYNAVLHKYSEAMEALDKVESSSMTNEENLYYLDVLTRVNKKLLEISN